MSKFRIAVIGYCAMQRIGKRTYGRTKCQHWADIWSHYAWRRKQP